ncbi:MAG TPA: EamA family transporter [Candidatus Bipolaricaulota bacterium]
MTPAAPPRLKVLFAFAAIYLIWGSTYLAIHYAIESLPPYLMTGIRFLVAGGLLYAWARLRGATATWAHWRSAILTGGLMLFGGMGTVAVAQQWVPSGVTALIIALVPLWMVLIEWLRPGGTRPDTRVWLGIGLSLVGLVLLVDPFSGMDGVNVSLLGVGLLLLSTLSWSAGSILSRAVPLPTSPLLSTGMQMLVASVLMLLVSWLKGDFAQLDVQAISARSVFGLGYLIAFGSIVAFTAYLWLLRVSTPALVGTYAFVNPVIAMLLGWSLNGESLTPPTLMGAMLILAAVAVIVSRPRAQAKASAPGFAEPARVAPGASPIEPTCCVK